MAQVRVTTRTSRRACSSSKAGPRRCFAWTSGSQPDGRSGACNGRQPAVAPSAAYYCTAPADRESTCLGVDAGSPALPLQQAQQRQPPRAGCLFSRARWAPRASARPAQCVIEATVGGKVGRRWSGSAGSARRRSAARLLRSQRDSGPRAVTEAARDCFRTHAATDAYRAPCPCGRECRSQTHASRRTRSSPRAGEATRIRPRAKVAVTFESSLTGNIVVRPFTGP
jgi:hypothetical protein